MNLLPVVQRELQVGARRVWVRWGRVGAVAVATLVCFQFFGLALPGQGTSSGQPVFAAMSAAGFVLALGMFFVTGDALSRERREGTLGLLFLTDLKGYDVVLGKLAGAGLAAVYVLTGFAPLFVLPLIAGGVTWPETARVTLAILNVAFVSLAVGIWRSARTAQHLRALRSAAAWLAALVLLPEIVSGFLPAAGQSLVAAMSPVGTIRASTAAGYAGAPGTYWGSLLAGQIMGWGLIALAGGRLQRNWREEMRVRAIPNPVLARRFIRRERMLGRAAGPPDPYYRSFAPVAVAVLRGRGLRAAAWFGGGLALTAGWLGTGAIFGWNGWAAWGLHLSLHWVALAIFAWLAGRFLSEARENGELELLATTTGGAAGLVRDQWFAVRRLLRGPFWLVVLGAMPNTTSTILFSGRMMSGEFAGLVGGLLGMVNVILTVLAVCWVAMRQAVTARRPFHGVLWAVGLVEALPLLLVMLVSLWLQAWMNQGVRGVGLWIWLLGIPLLTLAKNLFFIGWAHRSLCRRLRAPGVNWWGRFRRRAATERLPAAAPGGMNSL
jgi:hypothetical protein